MKHIKSPFLTTTNPEKWDFLITKDAKHFLFSSSQESQGFLGCINSIVTIITAYMLVIVITYQILICWPGFFWIELLAGTAPLGWGILA